MYVQEKTQKIFNLIASDVGHRVKKKLNAKKKTPLGLTENLIAAPLMKGLNIQAPIRRLESVN